MRGGEQRVGELLTVFVFRKLEEGREEEEWKRYGIYVKEIINLEW